MTWPAPLDALRRHGSGLERLGPEEAELHEEASGTEHSAQLREERLELRGCVGIAAGLDVEHEVQAPVRAGLQIVEVALDEAQVRELLASFRGDAHVERSEIDSRERDVLVPPGQMNAVDTLARAELEHAPRIAASNQLLDDARLLEEAEKTCA